MFSSVGSSTRISSTCEAGAASCCADAVSLRSGSRDEQIETIAEALHVDDVSVADRSAAESDLLCSLSIVGAHFQALSAKTGAQLAGVPIC